MNKDVKLPLLVLALLFGQDANSMAPHYSDKSYNKLTNDDDIMYGFGNGNNILVRCLPRNLDDVVRSCDTYSEECYDVVNNPISDIRVYVSEAECKNNLNNLKREIGINIEAYNAAKIGLDDFGKIYQGSYLGKITRRAHGHELKYNMYSNARDILMYYEAARPYDIIHPKSENSYIKQDASDMFPGTAKVRNASRYEIDAEKCQNGSFKKYMTQKGSESAYCIGSNVDGTYIAEYIKSHPETADMIPANIKADTYYLIWSSSCALVGCVGWGAYYYLKRHWGAISGSAKYTAHKVPEYIASVSSSWLSKHPTVKLYVNSMKCRVYSKYEAIKEKMYKGSQKVKSLVHNIQEYTASVGNSWLSRHPTVKLYVDSLKDRTPGAYVAIKENMYGLLQKTKSAARKVQEYVASVSSMDVKVSKSKS